MDRTGLRPTTDGSAGSEQAALEDMNKNYPKQQQSVPHPAPEPPKPEESKPSKSSSGKKSSTSATPSYIKQYNPDHNEFEPSYTIEIPNEEVEETPTFVEESSANIIEDVVITSFETVGTGLIKASSASHFKSHIDDALKLNGTAFAVAGVGVDFIDELQDGNGVWGAAILAVGHFATVKVVELSLTTMAMTMAIPWMTPIVILALTIVISSAIITLVDRNL